MKAAVGQVRQQYAFSQRRACRLLTMSVSSYRYQTKRSDEGLRSVPGGTGAGEAAVRLSALACFAATQGRDGESQARASGVSGGGIEYSAQEAQTLRAHRTAATEPAPQGIRNGHWTSCMTRCKAGERSGC